MTGTAARESGGGSAGKARSLATWSSTKLLPGFPKEGPRDGQGAALRFLSAGCAKDGQWGKKSASAASKKGLYSAGPRVYLDLGRLNQILIQVHYGTCVHVRSSGEGRRRKCRNEKLENLYQKAPCRGVLRGYQRNRLAERARGAGTA